MSRASLLADSLEGLYRSLTRKGVLKPAESVALLEAANLLRTQEGAVLRKIAVEEDAWKRGFRAGWNARHKVAAPLVKRLADKAPSEIGEQLRDGYRHLEAHNG